MMSNFSYTFADTLPSYPAVPVYSSVPTFAELSTSPIWKGTSSRIYYGTGNDGYYFFKYSTNGVGTFVFLRDDNNFLIYIGKNSVVDTSTYYGLDSASGKYYYTFSASTSNPVIESIGDFANVSQAIAYYFSNYTPPVPPAKSYYSLQNGWLSVIDLGVSGANYEFDLATSFQMNSGLISDTWGNGTTQRYWFSDSLPDENTSYLSTFGNAIEWEKGYPRNVFGQTKNATCTISGTSTGRYLYILNPALQKIWDEQSPSINNQPMTISGLTNGMNAKIYKLSATATLDGLNNAVDVNSGGSVTASDTSSDLTNSFTNSDDETVVQNAGGGNENEVAQSVNGYLQGIQNALDNFVNQFISLLSAPISHIQQMIESGSNFFSVFGQLFSWLPEEVSVIITGSLLIMVIIGVFKMFL